MEHDHCPYLLSRRPALAARSFKILLPVCMPVVAVLALWQFVAMWNSYFDAMIYLNSASKQPLQLVLRSILIQSQPESGMIADIQSTAERAKMAELLKYATIIISSLPLLCLPVAAANPPAAAILLPQLRTRPVPLHFRCPKRSPLPV